MPPPGEIDSHRAALRRYIRSLVRNDAEADDLSQETLLRAHRQQETLRDPGALVGWLYQIATRVSIDWLRQQARTGQRRVDQPPEDLAIADQKQASPLVVVQQAEMSACVQQHVERLGDAYKAVLLLHDTQGLTAKEIADLLQLPLTTVKMRLHRARGQLEVALNEGCGFEQDERGVLVCEPKREPNDERAPPPKRPPEKTRP